MKIFEIRSDVENYRWILPANKIDSKKIGFFRCDPKPDWEPVTCYVDNLKQEVGNFYRFRAGALCFDQVALDGMGDILEMAGEILPLELEEGGRLYVLNVLECVNALDKAHSEWQLGPNGKELYLKRYAFHGDRMHESSVFKIPDNNYGSVLTYTGVKDPEDEFIGRYQALGLTGLLFNELWSDE